MIDRLANVGCAGQTVWSLIPREAVLLGLFENAFEVVESSLHTESSQVYEGAEQGLSISETGIGKTYCTLNACLKQGAICKGQCEHFNTHDSI